MSDGVLFNVFPKSGTGMLRAFRGIRDHVTMFNKRGELRRADEYLDDILSSGVCTGHIPYSDRLHDGLKKNNIRVVFVFRNLRDVSVSLSNYVTRKEDSELNIMRNGVRLSRSNDTLLDCIYTVSEWWELFSEWMHKADSVYTYRELRGAALLLGREDQSETFLHGNINEWSRVFETRHLEAAQILPDILKEYNLSGYYEGNDSNV